MFIITAHKTVCTPGYIAGRYTIDLNLFSFQIYAELTLESPLNNNAFYMCCYKNKEQRTPLFSLNFIFACEVQVYSDMNVF